MMEADSLGTAGCSGHALITCKNPSESDQLVKSMRLLAIVPELCSKLSFALGLIGRQKFEAVTVDFRNTEEAGALLEGVRLSSSNRTAVTFAITDSDAETTAAHDYGASFVLRRPLTETIIAKVLRAAYGLIVRERRRYFRYPIQIPARIRNHDMQKITCETINISEGGMAVKTPAPLIPGIRIRVHFRIPGQATDFVAESETCWFDERGCAGLRFRALPPHQLSELQEWLTQKLEDSLPPEVIQIFRAGKNPETVTS